MARTGVENRDGLELTCEHLTTPRRCRLIRHYQTRIFYDQLCEDPRCSPKIADGDPFLVSVGRVAVWTVAEGRNACIAHDQVSVGHRFGPGHGQIASCDA